MKTYFSIVLFFTLFAISAQKKPELTPRGFAPVDIPKPAKTNEKLIELSKSWAPYYNKDGHDVYDVTTNGLSIDAIKDNAYYYMNLGEAFQHRIKYTMKVEFMDTVIRLTFIVKEIYANNTLTKTSVSDFFNSDGRLKEDFEEVRPSLENTAHQVMRSYASFIAD